MITILKVLEDNAAVISVATIWIGSVLGAYKLGHAMALRSRKREALQNRFDLIYAPLRAVVLGKHISTAQVIFYPKFSQRLRRAWPKLRAFEFRDALKRLSDKSGRKPTAEIEFGGALPYDTIRQTVKQNTRWADTKLLSLLQWTDRAHYESPGVDDSILIDEEYELIDHIYDMYYKLNHKLLPK